MDTFLKANIIISGVEDNGTQLKVKDENKKTYSFFKTKKDGTPTQAFSQFEYLKVGDRTGISYKEVPFTAKDGTPAKIKNITSFTPVFDQIGMPAALAKPEPTYHKEEGRNFKKEGYERCLWNYWLEKCDTDSPMKPEDLDVVWHVFNQIEQDANKRFATGMEKARAIFGTDEDPLPTEY